MVDICYLLGSSTSPEQREEHLDEWLKLYWTSLDTNLVRLGYPGNLYTYEEMMRNFKQNFLFGVVVGALHAMVSAEILLTHRQRNPMISDYSFRWSTRRTNPPNLTWTSQMKRR